MSPPGMTVAEAYYIAAALAEGAYDILYREETGGKDIDDLSDDEFLEYLARTPCPYPEPTEENGEDEGWPLTEDRRQANPWLDRPLLWFLSLSKEDQDGYLSGIDELAPDYVGRHIRDWVARLPDKPPDEPAKLRAEYKMPGKRLLAWLEDTTDLPASARFVARVLLDHYSPKNYAFPSQETLMRLTGLGERTVRNALKALVAQKVIRVVKPYQWGDRYASTVYDFTAQAKKAMGWTN